VLASWSRQFKDDRSAAGIAGLYRQVRPAQSSSRKPQINVETLLEPERESEQKRRDKEEAKRKDKEKRLKAEETRRKKATSQSASSRRGFDVERVRFPSPASICSRTTPLDLHIPYRRSRRSSLPLRTRRLPRITWSMLSRLVDHNFEASSLVHV